MSIHRYRITPQGPFATPLRSDTLYGHLICAAALLDGPGQAEALIAAFEAGTPPFAVSSAFPEGLLPMPALTPVPRQEFRKLADERPEFEGELLHALEAAKRFRKCAFVPESYFRDTTQPLSLRNLFTYWLDNSPSFTPGKGSVTGFGRKELEPHNSIHRMTGSVLSQGGFYLREAAWYGPDVRLTFYVEAEDRTRFERYLGFVADTGFGADRSTGKGHFTVAHDDAFDPALFARPGNARLSLSVCSAADLSGFAGTYDVFTKYGRVWSGFGESNPYKSPFVAFAEGAVFIRMPPSGYVLRGIHPNPTIVQVVQPLTLPVCVEA